MEHFFLSGLQSVIFPKQCSFLRAVGRGCQRVGEELGEVGGGDFPKHKAPLSEDVMKGPNVSIGRWENKGEK